MIALSVYFSSQFVLNKYLLPVFAIGNALLVNPGIEVIACQRVNDLLGEVNVFAGVGDEDMGHLESNLGNGRPLLNHDEMIVQEKTKIQQPR
jgi:hypothetical protein